MSRRCEHGGMLRVRAGGESPSPRPSPRKNGARGQKCRPACASSVAQLRWRGLRVRCYMRGAKVGKTNTARRLRRGATFAEQRLWYRPRSRSLQGMKIVRQEPIGPYIVDFVCRERRLVIEIDGGQHADSEH